MILKKIFRFICYLKKRFLKKKVILISIILFLIILKLIVNKKNEFDDLLKKLKKQNLKSVQLLTGRFDWINWGLYELGTMPFETCPEKRCYAFRSFITQEANRERYLNYI
jgi:hypothetical protein